ncbi:MAG: efflux RND transporter periplasmic adaptor subunit, partial [Myxococcota bacterium]
DVEPNRHLFEIADLGEVLAVGRVFEGQIGQVELGQNVRVRVPSSPEEFFDGVVDRLGGKLDPASRSQAVFVQVANPDEKLRPHMRATLSLVTERADLALAVSKSAVLGEFGNPFVFVQREDEPDLFDRRAVVTGLSDDRHIEIVDGVLPGERVVTEGNYSLQYLPAVPEPAADGEAAPSTTEAAHSHATEGGWRWGLGVGIAALFIVGLFIAGVSLSRRARAARGAR